MNEYTLINGKIYPFDKKTGTMAPISTLSVKNAHIAAEKTSSPAKTFDLKGAACLPGLRDSHMHLISYGLMRNSVDLSGAASIDDVIRLLRSHFQSGGAAGDSWIIGTQFNQEKFPDKHMPEKVDLDKVSDTIPIVIRRVCGHVVVCNSALLEAAGIRKDTFPGDKDIGRDVSGYPTGILNEKAIARYVQSNMPAPSGAVLEAIIHMAAANFASLGLVSVESDDLTLFPTLEGKAEVLAVYQKLRDEKKLSVRIAEQCQAASADELEEILPILKNVRADDMFSIAGIKLILDGSLGAETAALLNPYVKGGTGILNYTDDEFAAMARIACREKLPLICHAIGDAAIEQFIRVLSPLKDPPRLRIVHCQLPHKYQLDALSMMNAIADVQPSFITSDMDMVAERIDWFEREPVYGLKSYLKAGIVLSGSSDAPVETPSPLAGIQAAATRAKNKQGPAFKEEEKLQIEEAIALYTREGAASSGLCAKTGTLAEGCWADFLILEDDLFECDPFSIAEIPIRAVVCGGVVTFGKL